MRNVLNHSVTRNSKSYPVIILITVIPLDTLLLQVQNRLSLSAGFFLFNFHLTHYIVSSGVQSGHFPDYFQEKRNSYELFPLNRLIIHGFLSGILSTEEHRIP